MRFEQLFNVNRLKQACILRLNVTCENKYVVEGSFRGSREPADRKWCKTEMMILFIQNVSVIMLND